MNTYQSTSSNLISEKNAIVFTSYKPNKKFEITLVNIAISLEYLDVIIIDNTPKCFEFDKKTKALKNIIIKQDGINKGIGSALNIGLLYLKQKNYKSVMIFDQDSLVTVELIEKLIEHLNIYNKLYGYKCCIAPTHIDDSISIAQQDTKKYTRSNLALPMSGMTFSLKYFDQTTLFTENFFLDFVDFEWCWRMHTMDWTTFKLENVIMAHRVGIAQKKILGITYYKSAQYRHYFRFRDTLNLLTLKYVPIYPKLRYLLLMILEMITLISQDHRPQRLRWMLLGIFDFFIKKKGVGSAKRELCDKRDT